MTEEIRRPIRIICPNCREDMSCLPKYMQPQYASDNEVYFSCSNCNRDYIFNIPDEALWLLTKERQDNFSVKDIQAYVILTPRRPKKAQ
jgi:hypothetical protein